MRRIDVARRPLTWLVLLLGLVLFTSGASAEPQPQPEPQPEREPRYLEIGARAGPRIADCSHCDALPPGLGLSGFLGLRAHHHFAAGFTVGYERFLHIEDPYPFRGMSFLGLFARGYVMCHSTFDPYVELAGLAATPVGRCPFAGESEGEFGYRGALGADWRLGPGLKLGAAASYLRVRFECGGRSVAGVDTPETFFRPGSLGAFGVDLAVTAVPF